MKWLDNKIKEILNDKISNDNYDLLTNINNNLLILNTHLRELIIREIKMQEIIERYSDAYKKENLELKKRLAKLGGDTDVSSL